MLYTFFADLTANEKQASKNTYFLYLHYIADSLLFIRRVTNPARMEISHTQKINIVH